MEKKMTYDELAAKVVSLEFEKQCLKEELANLKRLIFGQKRERFVPVIDVNQLNLELGDVKAEPATIETEQINYTRRKNKKQTPHSRNPLPDHLPRKEIIIEPEEDVSGWKKIGEEITEELEYKPARFYVNRFIRPKYALPQDEGVVIGLLPSRPIEKGIAGPGLLSHVLISKYVDHLPLYRQIQQFKRENVSIAESTLCGWVEGSCNLLVPLYEVLRQQVIISPYLMVDETPIRVLDRLKKGTTHLGYHWVYYSPLERLALFDYRPGRSRAGPNEILQNFAGYLQTDGYAGYLEICSRSQVIALGCWAHARRYFVEAEQSAPKQVEEMLLQIQELYKIERMAREAGMSYNERHQLRQEYVPSILTDIKAWLDEEVKKILPKSAIGKAIGYALHQWPRLERYINDGRLEIDNNLVENLIRPVALGRKNYLFAGSHAGAKRAAMIYSFVATAKQHKVEPFFYLKDVLSRIADHSHSKLAELLPPLWQPLTDE